MSGGSSLPTTVSAHLRQVLGRVNYPFQKCQHGCSQIIEVFPEIFQGFPLLLFILLVYISDGHCGDFEEGSHIDSIFPWDSVEKSKDLHSHHVS